MTDYNPDYQISFNGPLSAKLKARFIALGNNDKAMTRRSIARNCDVSGSFLGKLLRSDDPAAVRTRHMDRIVMALEDLELRVAEDSVDNEEPDNGDSLESLIRFAHTKGFSVTFSPLAK